MAFSPQYLRGRIARSLSHIGNRAERIAAAAALAGISRDRTVVRTPKKKTVRPKPIAANQYPEAERETTKRNRHYQIDDPLYVPPLGTQYGVLPEGKSWPTEKYSDSPECEAAKQRSYQKRGLGRGEVPEVLQFLERVWIDLIVDQCVGQFVIQQIDRSLENALDLMKKKSIDGRLPAEYAEWCMNTIPTITEIYDQILQQQGIAELSDAALREKYYALKWRVVSSINGHKTKESSSKEEIARYRAFGVELHRRRIPLVGKRVLKSRRYRAAQPAMGS